MALRRKIPFIVICLLVLVVFVLLAARTSLLDDLEAPR